MSCVDGVDKIEATQHSNIMGTKQSKLVCADGAVLPDEIIAHIMSWCVFCSYKWQFKTAVALRNMYMINNPVYAPTSEWSQSKCISSYINIMTEPRSPFLSPDYFKYVKRLRFRGDYNMLYSISPLMNLEHLTVRGCHIKFSKGDVPNLVKLSVDRSIVNPHNIPATLRKLSLPGEVPGHLKNLTHLKCTCGVVPPGLRHIHVRYEGWAPLLCGDLSSLSTYTLECTSKTKRKMNYVDLSPMINLRVFTALGDMNVTITPVMQKLETITRGTTDAQVSLSIKYGLYRRLTTIRVYKLVTGLPYAPNLETFRISHYDASTPLILCHSSRLSDVLILHSKNCHGANRWCDKLGTTKITLLRRPK
jgi:hypothetical protein